jgi:hypothetical protein
MCVSQKEISAIDRELVRIAKEGTVKEFVRAILAHPIHGRLMRAFALEEDAPEYEETNRRIQEKFGLRKEELIYVGSQSGEHRGNRRDA